MPTAHIPHTTRLPRFLTAAAASAAALAATAPFAVADETWGATEAITNTRNITGMLSIEHASDNPVITVSAPGVVHSTGYLRVANNSNTKGTLTVTAGGNVSTANQFVIANQAGTVGVVTVTGENSTLHSDIKITIGNSGNGTLNIFAGGKVTSAANIAIGTGDADTGRGVVTVSGENSSMTAVTTIGVGGIAPGTLSIENGGTVTSAAASIGATSNTGIASVSGKGSSLNTDTLTVGEWSTGTLDIFGGGTVTAAVATIIGKASLKQGTLNLRTDGTLNTPSIAKDQGTPTLNLNGGTIRATANQADFFHDLGSVTLNNTDLLPAAPALIFDTNSYDVTSSVGATTTFTGSGGLTKIGTGTLTLTGAHTYTGTTTVSAGAVAVVGTLGTMVDGKQTHVGNIVLNGGSMSFANPGAPLKFTGILSGAGTISFESSQSVVVAGAVSPGVAAGATATLTFSFTATGTGNVVLAEGAQFVVDLAALGGANANDLLIVEGGNLVLDGAQLVIRRGAKFPAWSAKGGSEIVIAKVVTDNAEITGMFTNVDDKKFVTDATGRRALVSIRANTEGGQDLILRRNGHFG